MSYTLVTQPIQSLMRYCGPQNMTSISITVDKENNLALCDDAGSR